MVSILSCYPVLSGMHMLNASDRVEEWQDDFAAEAETSGETARQPSESRCRSRRACSERGGSSPISVLFFCSGWSSPSGSSPFTEHWKAEAGVDHEFLPAGQYYTVQGHLFGTKEALWFSFTPSGRIYA